MSLSRVRIERERERKKERERERERELGIETRPLVYQTSNATTIHSTEDRNL